MTDEEGLRDEDRDLYLGYYAHPWNHATHDPITRPPVPFFIFGLTPRRTQLQIKLRLLIDLEQLLLT